VLGAIEAATDQQSPTAFFFAGGADHHHATSPRTVTDAHAQHQHGGGVTLDQLVANVRAAGARGTIELQPRFDGAPINARDDHARAFDEVWLRLDAQSGAVLTKVVWDDFPMIPRFVALGVDLHEGRFFGRVNQIFNTLFAAALVWLSVTGFIGWYKRRPRGGPIAPPKREVRFPRAVLASGAVLCIVLPLLGASVLVIALVDRVAGRLLTTHS
jgi:uncharacterized iron-regulated membrane protein